MCKTFSVSLRDLDKIYIHIKASLLNLDCSRIHFFFLCYLVFVKHSDQVLYEKINHDEFDLFMKDVEESYPSYKLYFSTACFGVNHLAKEYIQASRKTPRQLSDQINEGDRAYSFQLKVFEDAANGHDFLGYKKVVDLASEIS